MDNTNKATSKGFKRLMKKWMASANASARSVYRDALKQPTGLWQQHLDVVPNEVKGAPAWWARKGG